MMWDLMSQVTTLHDFYLVHTKYYWSLHWNEQKHFNFCSLFLSKSMFTKESRLYFSSNEYLFVPLFWCNVIASQPPKLLCWSWTFCILALLHFCPLCTNVCVKTICKFQQCTTRRIMMHWGEKYLSSSSNIDYLVCMVCALSSLKQTF